MKVCEVGEKMIAIRRMQIAEFKRIAVN